MPLPSALTAIPARLDDRAFRLRVYAICAVMLYLMAMSLGIVKARFSHKEPRFDFAASDGKYYYLYISSAIVDGDLDFANQLREHWPMEEIQRNEHGYVHNKYTIGVSLSLAPSFLVAHGAAWVIHTITGSARFAPDGYSVPYQVLNLAWMMTLSWATFVMIDSLIARGFDVRGREIAIAVLSVWLGTQYLYHMVRFPLMAHVFSTFWATACIALAAGAVDAIRQRNRVGWHWPAMAFSCAMAFICRPTNLVVAPFMLFALAVLIRQRLATRLLAWLPLIVLLGVIPIVLQMLTWHVTFGHYIVNSYGPKEPFYWTRPLLWQTLFSLRAGLLLWCPVWTLGTIGAVMYLRRASAGAWLLWSYLIAFVVLWYMNSAWWCWPFSNYPGRGFVELIGLPAMGISLLLHHASSQSAYRIRIALLLAGIACTTALSVAYDLSLVPRWADDVIRMGPEAARQAG